jgi:hypothetical protein
MPIRPCIVSISSRMSRRGTGRRASPTRSVRFATTVPRTGSPPTPLPASSRAVPTRPGTAGPAAAGVEHRRDGRERFDRGRDDGRRLEGIADEFERDRIGRPRQEPGLDRGIVLALDEDEPVSDEVDDDMRTRMEVLGTQETADAPAREWRRTADGDDVVEGKSDAVDLRSGLSDVPRIDQRARVVGARSTGEVRKSGRADQVDGQDVVGRAGIEDESRRDTVDDGIDRRCVGHRIADVEPDGDVKEGRHRRHLG